MADQAPFGTECELEVRRRVTVEMRSMKGIHVLSEVDDALVTDGVTAVERHSLVEIVGRNERVLAAAAEG